MKSYKPFDRVSKGLAVSMDRRGFIRRAARGTFATAALLAAGGVTEVMKAKPAFAFAMECASDIPGRQRGAGCPGGGHWGSKFPCGPSRCCAYVVGIPSGCNCHNTSGSVCKNNTTHCHGDDTSDWGGHPSCWTCNSPQFSCGVGCTCVYQTTCCDCKTSGCSDGGTCISSFTSTVVLHC
jgi:hypothetical protein